jgi:NCAIR mutase (PurE)-related protein
LTSADAVFDFGRASRIGLDESVFCSGKTAAQIAGILQSATERGVGLLLTRLDAEMLAQLPAAQRDAIDYCAISRTAFHGPVRPVSVTGSVAIVAAGTSDAPVAREAERTLRGRRPARASPAAAANVGKKRSATRPPSGR